MTIENSDSDFVGQPDAVVRRLRNNPADLFSVCESLAKITVFGEWIQDADTWRRPEPGRRLGDSRVFVWHCDGVDTDIEEGWYYRVGFGVVGIAGFSNRKPFSTANGCKNEVDRILREQPSIECV